ncbi:MAG: ABC transporter ATP-binding protein/permease [Clostridia bacterium]|nr:ABC transporter ATP-binding protein/permease [Clostridia bacterium]
MTKDRKSASVFRVCAPFLRDCAGLYAFAVICGIIVNLITTVIPQLISYTVDRIMGADTSGGLYTLLDGLFGGRESLGDVLWVIALVIALLAAADAALAFAQNHSNTVATQRMTRSLRTGLFSHIGKLPLSSLSRGTTGDIIQRCTTDVDAITNFVSRDFLSLFRTVTLIILSLVFMFLMNVWLALIAFAFIPAVIAYSVLFQTKAAKHFMKCDEEEGVLSSMAQENYTGVRVVRAFGRERYESEKFEKQNVYYTGLWVKIERWLSLFWTSSAAISSFQLLTVISVGTVFCVRGSLTAGDLVSFILYNTMLLEPTRQLGRVIANMSRARISAVRIGEILNEKEEPYSSERRVLSGGIRMENVTFGYREGFPVLRGLNLTVPEGTTLGILGGTGSGKSTIANLLCALYPIDSGKIYIGDDDVGTLPPNVLRENIGYVMQDGYLFSGTIRDNICACGEIPNEKMRECARTTCVDGDIEGFPAGYDTVVGERGVTLSGGQRQRVSMARTLARERKYLILDDSLSAVDAETDEAIRGRLPSAAENVTTVIISHRISSVMRADNIVVLEGGKVAEEGTHEELMALGGRYRRIYDAQTALPNELGEARDE